MTETKSKRGVNMANKTSRKPDAAALQKLRERDKEKRSEKLVLLDQFNTSYKNILWIDDRDDSDAGSDQLDWMQNYCDADTCMHIEQVDLFREAVDKIVSDSTRYDLVIFDINLKNGFDEISEEETNRIEKCFEKHHIKCKLNEIDYGQAGYYLFRLLLSVGYPLERMLIFSGHATKEKAQDNLKDLIIDKRIFILKEKGKLDIEHKFFDANTQQYYRIRRLVYQACQYWITQLNSSLQYAKDVPFNKIYYYNDKNGSITSPISVSRFIEMLEHIQLLFPVTSPKHQDKLYYKVMQTVVSFHEESAKIQMVNDNMELKRYHSCVRNFRNWSAHNLMDPELTAGKFALLFCITLRTYFKWAKDCNLNDDLLSYEKEYNFALSKQLNVNTDAAEHSLLAIWEAVHQKIKKTWYSDLGTAIRELGRTENCGNMGEYLFVPLWCPLNLLLSPEIQTGHFNQSGEVMIRVNRKEIEQLCQKAQNIKSNSSDVCFKRFCYQWVIQ